MKKSVKNLLETSFMLVFFIIIPGLYYSLQIYNDYYQGVRSYESFRVAKEITTAISKYYSSNQSYPKNIDELNLDNYHDSSYVGDFTFDNESGVLISQLAGDNLGEGVLIFFPRAEGEKEITYICGTLDVPDEHIPENCKKL